MDVHARSIRLAAVRADEERVYVGYWFWGRPSPYKLWDDLESVFRRLKPDFDPTTALPVTLGLAVFCGTAVIFAAAAPAIRPAPTRTTMNVLMLVM